jgi:alpha-amylase
MSGRVMMWANMRRGESLAVPAPFDDNSSPYWWYDRIAGWARGWSRTGITDVLFPNPIKGQSGAYRTGDGYNPFDDGDIGSKDQLGRKPTRFGDADQLRRAIAICKANGLNVLLDHVMHQRMGGKNGVYRYVSATGKTNGRFPKDPGCFSPSAPGDTIPPYVPVDPVPDQADNFPFGNPLAPVNSIPKGYVWNGLLNAGDWLFRTTGANGARLDDMKGTNIGFIKAFMTYGAMRGKWFFGEYASGNPNDTNWWVSQVDGLSSAADFGFHYARAMAMCNDSTFDMGRLKNNWEAMYQTNPMKAVTFVESMDSDTNGFATIVFNKLLGYALMLTSEGLPCVYIRDYLKEPDCYGLEDEINNLIWCAQMLAGGSTVPRLTNNPRVYVFERMGWGEAPGCVVALSNDYFWSGWHTVTVQTHFGPNAHLHDFTGHNAQDCWTDSQGRATFGVPPAAGGVGFGVWGPASMQGAVHQAPPPRSALQDFDGADDLDIGPLDRGSKYIGRVWAEANTHISMLMEPNILEGFSTEQRITSPGGLTLVSGKSTHVYSKTKERGWHTLYAQMLTGATPTMPFTLHAEYTAPQTLDVSEFGS